VQSIYIVSDLETAMQTETQLIIENELFDGLYYDDYDGNNFDQGYIDVGPGMTDGSAGDTVEYQGEFERYIVTTVDGDELSTDLVSEAFMQKITELDAAAGQKYWNGRLDQRRAPTLFRW
jgi:fibronectin type 3 domain-containing protein